VWLGQLSDEVEGVISEAIDECDEVSADCGDGIFIAATLIGKSRHQMNPRNRKSRISNVAVSGSLSILFVSVLYAVVFAQ
jgi:hypothetical protein